jgi:hypothetical protein
VIENEKQLQYSVGQLARMYRMRDREAAEACWDPETREDVLAGTDNVIRKVEREVAEYLAKKYEVVASQPGKAA